MKKLVFVFMALIFSGFTFAQAPKAKKNIALALRYDRKDLKRGQQMPLKEFRNQLGKWAKKNYRVGAPGLVTLWFSVDADNEKTIEGMETVTLADVTLKIKLVNSITDEEKVWEKVVKSRGTSIPDLERSAIRKLSSNGGAKEMARFFDEYLVDEFVNHCSKYYAIAEKKYAEGKYVEAIRILSYIQDGTTCEKKAKNLMKEALLLEQKKVCNDYLYKANLAYESGDYERSLSQLYQISPRSLCAKDAMELAKKIGEKFEHSNVSTKSINIHKFIVEHADLEKQAEWDEKIMMDLIRHN